MSPWSRSLGLNHGRGPFFLLAVLKQQSVEYRTTSIDVKTGSPDSTDCATTRHLICRLYQLAQRLGRSLAYRSRHSAIRQAVAVPMPHPADFTTTGLLTFWHIAL
jgi:hypothetical protein